MNAYGARHDVLCAHCVHGVYHHRDDAHVLCDGGGHHHRAFARHILLESSTTKHVLVRFFSYGSFSFRGCCRIKAWSIFDLKEPENRRSLNSTTSS